jgi:hypothetical protein
MFRETVVGERLHGRDGKVICRMSDCFSSVRDGKGVPKKGNYISKLHWQ